MYDAGEYHDNKRMIDKVLKIAEKWGVHLYMSGHEHQTQVLHNSDISPSHFIITGCTAEKRSGKNRVHPALVRIDPKTSAFVQLSISNAEVVYLAHKAAGDPAAAPLFEGTIAYLAGPEEPTIDEEGIVFEAADESSASAAQVPDIAQDIDILGDAEVIDETTVNVSKELFDSFDTG
jgi:hypothetical protein